MFRQRVFTAFSTASALALFGSLAHGASCDQVAGHFVSMEGQVEVASGNMARWNDAQANQTLCQGDAVRVGPDGRAALALVNDAVLRIAPNTTLRLVDIAGQSKQRSFLELIKGALQSFSRKPRVLTVNTPYLNGSIEGTEFALAVQDGETRLTVFEGTVIAANDRGSLPVTGGQAATAAKGQAPQARVVVRPRDEVHWALYYPPVLAAADAQGAAGETLRRAAHLLQVGQAGQARALLESIPASDPATGVALAQRAVIAVVQNERGQALTLAEQAVAAGGGVSAALALSYAQQAYFRIEAARDTLAAAVAQHPDAALAWARLGELELMLGRQGPALEAARRADELSPNLSRTAQVRGFAALAQYRQGEAQAAFERAIALDSADPLGHFGRGLALIANGAIEPGRAELEAAAALDGSNALLRAYLGKAYGAERRTPLDMQQYEIARELDPNDPTPWLYEGLLLQSINRPIEAVQALERSRSLNDNRAVYRSRQLLDQDQAARGASQARAYGEIGFGPLATDAAAASLALDPANAAAHRFLADSYSDVRRHEISRVSELFQSQLLQDSNLNPIQASSGETNLNLVSAGGPAAAGFNEFNALFQRNRVGGTVSAWGGNRSTLGGEALVAGQYGAWSLAAGAFGDRSDGWRENNGLNHQIRSLFGQWAVSPQLSVQAEFRHLESSEGDLSFNFDPATFIPIKTVRRDQDVGRIGLRFAPSADRAFVLSYIHSDVKYDLAQYEDLPAPPFSNVQTSQKLQHRSDQYEAQYIHSLDRANFLVGAAQSVTTSTQGGQLDFVFFGVPQPPIPLDATERFRNPHAYGYLNMQPAKGLTLTLGLSADRYSQDNGQQILRVHSINPKFGIRWQVLPGLQLRAAAIQVVKPALANNRTLEPTQVAGFNQFFDDISGTRSRRYAAGADWRISSQLASGLEISARQLEEPVLDQRPIPAEFIREKRHEQLHRLYALWTPSDRLALNASLSYDRFRSLGFVVNTLPERVDTVTLPLGITYFDPSGFFLGARVTGVRQRVVPTDPPTTAFGKNTFALTDAQIGYRSVRYRASASLAALNIFDRKFRYQDDSYREFRGDPATGPYFPERMVQLRVTVNF
ncbi:MAG: TonB-dependent receptor [Rhodocyclaceae bacterium]|nr:TonB-dependent receptor [Rhodocyclaceae bacterium]MBX3668791.1 TonB-dependent receptor [Rhodocyclaceae bacterium]